jgi:uroporphyrinogen-III synthase
MRLLVTRPLKDAEPLIQKLVPRGHEARAVPLLDIVARPGVFVPSRPFGLICLTSANGLVSRLDLSRILDVPLIAVGPQSAEAAASRGFTNITKASGDVEGVVASVTHHFKPGQGEILYLSGQETSGDLEGRLQALGFLVTRLITYDAVPTKPVALSEDVAWAEAVLLYSPRSARLWQKALQAESVEAVHLTHICLSQNVAKALQGEVKTIVATLPNEAGILSALDHK